jgi:hypothetical protein
MTVASTSLLGSHAMAGNIVRCSQAPPHATVKQAATPPNRARSELSVSSWKASRLRLAPRASRIAISRRRATARSSRRPAMFEHAMPNRTNAMPTSQAVTRASGM